ncbi:MAG: ribokinase [Acutalibacteraceae bacterium]|nr:ribokinase [Acutalibacteraceae bacterium]
MAEKNIKFLNFGSLNTDMVYTVDHTVRPGETIVSSKLEYFCGGKGLNQSIALSRAGAKVFQAGCVGSDGDCLIEQLEKNGIDVHFVRKSDMPSGHAIIQVDKNGQNSILCFGGANRQITAEHIADVLSGFKAGDRLFLQNEIGNVDKIISAASEKGMDIVFNPSPFGEEIQTFPLEKVSWFVVNETEAQYLTGETVPEKILNAFSAKYPSASILLTLGGDGAYCKADGKIYFRDIFNVPVVDTTAAGDTFLGFFFATLDSRGVEEALKYASAASAIAVSRNGASSSIPTVEETENFIKNYN